MRKGYTNEVSSSYLNLLQRRLRSDATNQLSACKHAQRLQSCLLGVVLSIVISYCVTDTFLVCHRNQPMRLNPIAALGGRRLRLVGVSDPNFLALLTEHLESQERLISQSERDHACMFAHMPSHNVSYSMRDARDLYYSTLHCTTCPRSWNE